ncbi:general odorant-binding protein 28a [Megalopta genalis]|uniref:general odorant-binding protein 28a n=1 Tax=Megalopta genalis TaxID=115081 RepID=UPI001443081D|nr:uncharacterized protein LOC117221240 [Megalopta genalis]
MKSVVAVAILLAAVASVRGIDQDTVIPKYMEYLMPDVQPCADEFKLTQEQFTNIQRAGEVDQRQMGCLKACVMKRIGILTGTDFHIEPIYKMISVVHAGNDQDIKDVTAIADACVADIKGETDECVIGNKYTDCYVAKILG